MPPVRSIDSSCNSGSTERNSRKENQCPEFQDEHCCESGDEFNRDGQRAVPSVQDATFLNAVLPFLMSQANRNRQPLSVICIAVDRLNGIRDLLGLDQADQAVREVGLRIAGAIRASDVVARLDDDRIIAILPCACLPDAWRIADNVCHAIEHCHPLSTRTSLADGVGRSGRIPKLCR